MKVEKCADFKWIIGAGEKKRGEEEVFGKEMRQEIHILSPKGKEIPS